MHFDGDHVLGPYLLNQLAGLGKAEFLDGAKFAISIGASRILQTQVPDWRCGSGIAALNKQSRLVGN